jgi:predicted ferric reductase
MRTFNIVLLILHFLGLAMGLSVSIGNMVMAGVMARATAPEKGVLARFPPALSKVGKTGLVILWVTGLTMAYTKWNGIAAMPWTFHVKLTAVVLLTVVVGYISMLEARIKRGDAAAAARIPAVGGVALLCALTAVVFAVITFE